MRRIRRYLSAVKFYLFNHFVTNIPIYWLRHEYLRKALRVKIGKNSSVHMGCFITGEYLEIGNQSVINRKCYLDGRVGIIIGDNVSVSPEVYIISLTHDPQDPAFSTQGEKVFIDDYAWIGARAIVQPGVKISKGSVVGAGAVVTKSYDPYSIIAGVPAKCIGERIQHLTYSLSYFPFFDTDIQL